MSRFSSYGQADSQMLDEIDAGFFGFNNRFRPDQLKSGVLADSQNGRMDLNGEWQVRKGVDVISGSLLIAGSGINVGTAVLDDGGTGPVINNEAVPNIRGSCAFSDPTESRNNQYIVIALSTKAKLVNLVNRIVTDIDYPAGVTVDNDAFLLQAFNKIILFRDGKTPLLWDGDEINDFVKAESGTFIQPVRLGNVANNTVIVDGEVTVTSNAHGLSVGDEIVVTESNNNLTVGDKFAVATVSTNTFTFFAEVDDQTIVENHYTEPVSEGIGYTRMPAPAFGVYHGERLAVPFNYNVNPTVDSYTAREGRDEIILSNGQKIQTYDDLNGKFRPNLGTADFLVGLHSFTKETLVLFNRNSIHIISGTSNLKASSVSLITNEIGCVARNSIVQVGENIMFLSDNGVYGVSFQDLYNLRGNEVPLSESIDATIQQINKEYWSKSVGVYFDNKYYLAVPVGLGANKNNKIIIYNFLNKQWESVDSVNDPTFDFDNLIVAGDKSNRAVYAVNSLGGVHKIESREDGVDRITADPSTAGLITSININPSITTRQFNLKNIDRKKWNTFEIHTESSAERVSDFSISAETENIDYNLQLGTLSDRLGGQQLARGEDVSIRGRIGNSRAYGIQFTLNSITGRPKIKSLKVTGAQAFRSTNTAI